jgi:aryl-alcohol dehydrogenase-like predicted oxidoreductase
VRPMQLILGTAEFGQVYGFGVKEKPSVTQVKEILDCAKEAGITKIDTALSYGCQPLLGDLLDNSFEIITKAPALTLDLYLQCLQELNRDQIYAILLHCSFQSAISVCPVLPCSRVGASVYCESQLEQVLANKAYSVVQLPLNIRETWAIPYITALRQRGVEVYARSVFKRGELLSQGYGVKECLEFVKDRVDGLVIGVNSRKELEEILKGVS